MFYAGLAGAVISAIISIVLYVKMGISQAFQDLTGLKLQKVKKQKKKEIEKQQVEKPITHEILPKKQFTPNDRGRLEETELMVNFEETALMEAAFAEETTFLTDETMLLSPEVDETVLLTEEPPKFYFKQEVDVVVVHSSSKI